MGTQSGRSSDTTPGLQPTASVPDVVLRAKNYGRIPPLKTPTGIPGHASRSSGAARAWPFLRHHPHPRRQAACWSSGLAQLALDASS
ncbi:hypothetical protein VTJ04DRAFT_4252 [Mycothermus thermophilus]|uniref:uncharacterized protein n=1 Tax=Humicola insolens TaxID=85995 RepID=UPI0037438E13